MENTQANKHLADISNMSAQNFESPSVTTKKAESSKVEVNASLAEEINDTVLPMRNYFDMSNLNHTILEQQNVSMDLVNNSNSFINMTANCTVSNHVLDQTDETEMSILNATHEIRNVNKTLDFSVMPIMTFNMTVCEQKTDLTVFVTEEENSSEKTYDVSPLGLKDKTLEIMDGNKFF